MATREERKASFNLSISELSRNQGPRGVIFTAERLKIVISEVEEAIGKRGKSSKDYRRVAAFDVLSIEGEKFIIKRKKSEDDPVLYYIALRRGFKFCSCQKGCKTNTCKCKKSRLLCNSKCDHSSLPCHNK
jgi:hypothetical protein